jgi:hypothetical protein
MNARRTILHAFAIVSVTVSSLVAPSQAMPIASPDTFDSSELVVPVQSDCYSIGRQQAEQVGGQLARATPEMRGGQQVCVIVVLMPARDGQRPRRTEIVVPMG